jgi:hypothetical protein
VIAGLPWTAWLLLLSAVAPGVTLALLSLRAHLGDAERVDPSEPGA